MRCNYTLQSGWLWILENSRSLRFSDRPHLHIAPICPATRNADNHGISGHLKSTAANCLTIVVVARIRKVVILNKQSCWWRNATNLRKGNAKRLQRGFDDLRKERAGPCYQDPARKNCYSGLLPVLFHQLINAGVADRDRFDRCSIKGLTFNKQRRRYSVLRSVT